MYSPTSLQGVQEHSVGSILFSLLFSPFRCCSTLVSSPLHFGCQCCQHPFLDPKLTIASLNAHTLQAQDAVEFGCFRPSFHCLRLSTSSVAAAVQPLMEMVRRIFLICCQRRTTEGPATTSSSISSNEREAEKETTTKDKPENGLEPYALQQHRLVYSTLYSVVVSLVAAGQMRTQGIWTKLQHFPRGKKRIFWVHLDLAQKITLYLVCIWDGKDREKSCGGGGRSHNIPTHTHTRRLVLEPSWLL